jgi:hypothetical protein
MVGEPMFFYSVAKPIARDSKMDCSAADIPVVLAQCGKDVVAFDVSDSMVEVRGVDIRQYAFRQSEHGCGNCWVIRHQHCALDYVPELPDIAGP